MKKADLKIKEYVGIEEKMSASLEIADIVNPEDGEYKPHFRKLAEFIVFCRYFVDGLTIEEDDDYAKIYDEDAELRKLYRSMTYWRESEAEEIWYSVISDASELISHRTEMAKKVDLESKYETLIGKQIEYETARIDLVTESVREKRLSNDMLEKMTPEAIVDIVNKVSDGSLSPQNVGTEILGLYRDNIVQFPVLDDDLK